MTQVLITSDLHLTENPADAYRHTFMEGLVEIAARRGPDVICILGDLTEKKDRHPAVLVNRVVEHITALAAIAPVVALEGNHDYANEGQAFFAFLKRIPRVTWVSRVTAGRDLPLIDGVPKARQPNVILGNAIFCPHTRDYVRDWESIKFDDYKWAYAHNTFNGAIGDNGRKLEGIPLHAMGKRIRIVSGDVHKPQVIGPVTYVGAPYTVDFGDDYVPRLLAITQGDAHSVGVGQWPQKRVVSVDDVAALDKIKGLNSGDVCRVKVSVDDMGGWTAIRQSVIDWGVDRGLDVQRVIPLLMKKTTRQRVRIRASDELADNELIVQFSKRNSLDIDTQKMGIEILKATQ